MPAALSRDAAAAALELTIGAYLAKADASASDLSLSTLAQRLSYRMPGTPKAPDACLSCLYLEFTHRRCSQATSSDQQQTTQVPPQDGIT